MASLPCRLRFPCPHGAAIPAGILRQRKPPAGKIQGPDRDSPRPGGGVFPAPYAGAS